jgi:hypothetical protein
VSDVELSRGNHLNVYPSQRICLASFDRRLCAMKGEYGGLEIDAIALAVYLSVSKGEQLG